MKKLLSLIIALALCASLAACGGAPAQEPPQNTPSPAPEQTGAPAEAAPETSAGKALIVYFSHTGNTERIAEYIGENVEADVFRVEPETPYTDDYNTLLDVAQSEKNENARPAMVGYIDNLDDYDTVYLGWPCWWGSCPMIMLTFLEQHDLAGKTIAPFTTSGGSGFGSSIADMQAVCPDAVWLEGLAVGGSSVESAAGDVQAWLAGLDLAAL